MNGEVRAPGTVHMPLLKLVMIASVYGMKRKSSIARPGHPAVYMWRDVSIVTMDKLQLAKMPAGVTEASLTICLYCGCRGII